MDDWLSAARDDLARAAGLGPEELELDRESVKLLLDLARMAAHESGERTNAPLLCYLVGLAARGDVSLDDLAAAVRPAARG